ncbi:MAG: MBL fold metallo-hydrolase, partial [Actinomycetota bacterium]|nr:MBL fold metallo-hydrolase [Actinomycetota bacterium]
MSDEGGLSLTVLGCDGSYPGAGGACSGYLISDGETSVWLDAGSGTLANLQRHVAIEDLDAVVISHVHPDHWTDLEHLVTACRWVVGRRGVPVYAPVGLEPMIRPGNHDGTLAFHTITEGSMVNIGDMRWTFSQTDHPVATMAARVD